MQLEFTMDEIMLMSYLIYQARNYGNLADIEYEVSQTIKNKLDTILLKNRK